MSEAANDSDYLRDRAIIESYPDDNDVRLTGAEFKKLMMNRLESDTRFRAIANSAIEYFENAPPAPIIIAAPALQAQLAECNRLRKMAVEALDSGYRAGYYIRPESMFRKYASVIEANRRYEEGK